MLNCHLGQKSKTRYKKIMTKLTLLKLRFISKLLEHKSLNHTHKKVNIYFLNFTKKVCLLEKAKSLISLQGDTNLSEY